MNKSNWVLKILVPVVIGIAIFILVKNKNAENSISSKPTDTVFDLSEQEAKDLGLTAGDTPHDTLRTLLGEVKSTKAEVHKVNEENERLIQENSILRANSQNIEQHIDSIIEERTANLVHELEQRMENMKITAKETVEPKDIPIGNSDIKANNMFNKQSMNDDGVRWIEPLDKQITDENGRLVDSNFTGKTKTNFPSPFKALDDSPLGDAAVTLHGKPNQRDNISITPYYTIPENSTLTEAVAMSALLGRIPLEGTVTDPYPFKILIGRDNLIANGIELPDVEGAIVSGTASGDWTLSCVRGEVKSITFVFSDGRISNGKSNSLIKSTSNEENSKQVIGWLSDPNGVPCIPGVRKTNAPEYLTSQFLLSGASAAAQSFAQGQTTTVVDGGSVIGAVTGNQGKYVLGQAIGGGLNEVQDWYRKRYGQTFDAVYVPPGQKVAINITQELRIDYNLDARKVKYNQVTGHRQMD
ncbi:TIGR03752 family integrating conjugative element protein [Pasteurella skyensis]|uniref:TIGR03752 family integrating conjugative element protein n=1 Tax=Phocoenobacter skyensis TaxID=97481 RepID=UPI002766A63F|nr:TIGR03752 family integrating conjugative element protein [Pasteurella skyensis]MDP8189068.1 TIGR03752 family integrating conjugative element protein [Pasteurella skyensis]